ncbi:MAG TPA: thioredoxin fold domain-containing protein [Casimicrobiaceae bacterium]
MNSRLGNLILASALAACAMTPDTFVQTAAAAALSPSAANAAASKPTPGDTGIAWYKGDVDAAFVAAKADNRPVFLYWGAVWCPPCNQVKATIFNRQDFIERSRFFVPVYIDGDSPSAQRLGARFKVSGYPTMILLKPDGSEITRLPGEVDAEQYMRVLTLGMNGARPVKETLAAALARDGAKLTPEDWRMLAYYSWETDQQQLLSKEKLASTLQRVAQACPADQPETAVRLKLQALIAAANAKDAKPRDDRTSTVQLMAVLANPKLARENFDLLVYYPREVANRVTLPKSPERARVVAAWNAALERLVADPSLSTADRLSVVNAQVALAKLDAPKATLADALLKTVREQAARADQETSDPYARQAVISGAAEVLDNAGLGDESDALLKRELTRTHYPYYFMLGLAANAKRRGEKGVAVDWAEKAYAAAEGGATRLQWGAGYVNTMIDLAPQDAPRIEKAALKVIGELDPSPDTFYERNRRSLERMGKKLVAWNKDSRHDDSLKRIRAQMASVCAKLPASDPARTTCSGVLRPASGAKA